MAKRPNAQGSATIKHEENWEKVGGVGAWLESDDCGGVITLDIKKMIGLGLLDAKMEELKVNFRVWKGNCARALLQASDRLSYLFFQPIKECLSGMSFCAWYRNIPFRNVWTF